jgi:hypothetical protein
VSGLLYRNGCLSVSGRVNVYLRDFSSALKSSDIVNLYAWDWQTDRLTDRQTYLLTAWLKDWPTNSMEQSPSLHYTVSSATQAIPQHSLESEDSIPYSRNPEVLSKLRNFEGGFEPTKPPRYATETQRDGYRKNWRQSSREPSIKKNIRTEILKCCPQNIPQ